MRLFVCDAVEWVLMSCAVPSRVGEKEPHYGSADQAVLIIGLIASDKFKLLSAAYVLPFSSSSSD